MSEHAEPPPILSAIPSTLRIPLAARALGDALFPELAVDDHHAVETLRNMGDDGRLWLQDRQSVYGVLARTRWFRDQARAFLANSPSAHVVNLGCGLSDYLQWLDNGLLCMTDADLPEVIAIRRKIMPPLREGHILAELDLNNSAWWDLLGLPASRDEEPVFMFSEGVFMYLEPATIDAVLSTFGERAPAGSVLAFDAMCWLAIGRAKHHPSVKHTDAQFHWGPRKLTDLTRPHARLTLLATFPVMASYNLFYRLMTPILKLTTEVPFYAVYAVGV